MSRDEAEVDERRREGVGWEHARGVGRGYIMGNARGIPRDHQSSPVRMRRAD